MDRLKCLAGLPIAVEPSGILVYPITLSEIAQLGVSNFFRMLNLLTLTKDDVDDNLDKEFVGTVEPFDFLLQNSIYSQEFGDQVIASLKFFTKKEVFLLQDMQSFVIGDFEKQCFLDNSNFEEFQNTVREQNFLNCEVKSRGENLAAKRINARIRKAQKKIQQIKGRNEEQIEIADLVSSLCINTSLNIHNVWNISYYAFNDQFKRMRLLEQYSTGLQSIMVGADPKKIKLKDWIQNIQDN